MSTPNFTGLETLLQRTSVTMLRCAVGIVYVWFGALKLLGYSPVADFVANTLPWFDRRWLVPAIGVFEVLIGLALFAGRFLTVVCALLIAHLGGTFFSLLMQPEVTFQHGNPLLLTEEGEFVMKNLVFLATGLVIAARFRGPASLLTGSRRKETIKDDYQIRD